MTDSNPFADPVHTERFDEKRGKTVSTDPQPTPLIAPPPPKPTTPIIPAPPKKDLDDYNPFDDAQQTEPKPTDKPPRGAEGISWFGFGKQKQKYTVSSAGEATDTPPTYSDTSSAAMRELKQREDELAKREQALKEREDTVGYVSRLFFTILL